MRPTSIFGTGIGIAIGLLLCAIIAISILLYNSGPRVRFIRFSQDPSITTLNQGTSLSVTFDRPIQQRDYSDQIWFSPHVDFTAQTATQSITVTFAENLAKDTDYTFHLSQLIVDTGGKQLSGEYAYEFRSASLSYMYIERNYSSNTEADTEDQADDHIILVQANQPPVTVFSHPNIKLLDANSEYATVVTMRDGVDNIHILRLDTLEVERVMLADTFDELTMSPRSKVALFTSTPAHTYGEPDRRQKIGDRVVSINLENSDIQALSDQDGDGIQATSIHVDAYGKTALVKDRSGTYYAVSPYDDFDPVVIGKYTDSYGFSEDVSEIIFRDGTEFVRYDIATGDIISVNIEVPGDIRFIAERNSDIFVGSSSIEAGVARNFVNRLDDWKKEPAIVWAGAAFTDFILRDMSVSYDGTVLALQLDPIACSYDRLYPNAQCQDTQTVLFDTTTNEMIASSTGFNLVWLP